MLRIGKIQATHGVEGMLVVRHILPDILWVKKGMALFVSLRKDSYIPYFVTSFRQKSADEILLQLEDVDSLEAAQKLRGKEIYAEEAHIRSHSIHSPLAWIGFNVEDEQHGTLGKLEDVYQSGAQWLGQLFVQEKEVLLPLIPEFLLEIDIDRQRIKTRLPDGLLEVYIQ